MQLEAIMIQIIVYKQNKSWKSIKLERLKVIKI